MGVGVAGVGQGRTRPPTCSSACARSIRKADSAADATYRLAQRAFDAKDYDRAASWSMSLDEGAGARRPTPEVREYAMFLRGQIAVAKADWPKVREAFEALRQGVSREPAAAGGRVLDRRGVLSPGRLCAPPGRGSIGSPSRSQEKREPWMAMIPLRRAQVLAQQNQWNDAQAIAAKIETDFPDFEQQYEVDYLLGRCLANQADFEGARQAYGKVIRSAAGAKTETAAMAQWMIGETYFHQKNYEAALREYLTAGDSLRLSHLAGRGRCCRPASATNGWARPRRPPSSTDASSKIYPEHDVCRRGRQRLENSA